jgi:acetylglutamate kinase
VIPADKENLDQIKIKAKTLVEAAPWIRKFQGKIVVIKFGGNAMVDEALQRTFAEDVAFLHLVGIQAVVVHGGGPQISAGLADAGIESTFVDGLRVTSPEAISVIRDVLKTQIGEPLAQMIVDADGKAEVFNGETEGLFTATQSRADLGLVGVVTSVNTEPILRSLDASVIPVIATIAPDSSGQLLNVNADLAASSLSVALKAEKLIVLTDVPGLYSNWPSLDSLISEISVAELEELFPSLESGMIPKMQACLEAVRGGVQKAHIIDGRIRHSLLLEIFTTAGIGTLVTQGDRN